MDDLIEYYDYLARETVRLPDGWRDVAGDVIDPAGHQFVITGPHGRWAMVYGGRRYFRSLRAAVHAHTGIKLERIDGGES